ncbi:MAG: hypothetical protein H6983_04450 [Ectothiorhodospiraceae bacterium]|nr:hypothetical protein [Ectothiorhodospiraceae bacterium]
MVLLALLLIGSRLALAAHAHQHALDSGNPDCELCEHAHGATAAPAPDEPALGAAIARNADVHVAPVDAPTRPASAYHSRAPPGHARRRAT